MRKSYKLKADYKEQMKAKVIQARQEGSSFVDVLEVIRLHKPKGNQIEMLKKQWSLQVVEEVIKEESFKDIALSRNNNNESIADKLFRWIRN